MKVYLLLIGYEADIVRVFATKDGRDIAAKDVTRPLAEVDDVEVEGLEVEAGTPAPEGVE